MRFVLSEAMDIIKDIEKNDAKYRKLIYVRGFLIRNRTVDSEGVFTFKYHYHGSLITENLNLEVSIEMIERELSHTQLINAKLKTKLSDYLYKCWKEDKQ